MYFIRRVERGLHGGEINALRSVQTITPRTVSGPIHMLTFSGYYRSTLFLQIYAKVRDIIRVYLQPHFSWIERLIGSHSSYFLLRLDFPQIHFILSTYPAAFFSPHLVPGFPDAGKLTDQIRQPLLGLC